ncbi:MAG: hypothetical protein WDZ51_19805 [Pirellulaceae bacterium]
MDLFAANRNLLEKALGYLNFSSGEFDRNFAVAIDDLYRAIPVEPDLPPDSPPTWQWNEVGQLLRDGLRRFQATDSPLGQAEQAEWALNLTYDQLLPAYLKYHEDLLFQPNGDELFSPFFLVRVLQLVLRSGPADDQDALVEQLLDQLNDYVGYRPVAVLENHKSEPYPHEYCRPVPIMIAGAGVCMGRYTEIVTHALKLLEKTDPEILRDAGFDLARLEELAIDPRAYDFDHPVNKRPNYQFGQWDPDHLDSEGRYQRFVVQQVTLDALTSRVETGDTTPIPREELVYEAAAVLAGVILMGSGICGASPDAHHSEMTLSKLLPGIASYRDRFYDQLLKSCPKPMASRLKAEAIAKRQPFGAARQHLNAFLGNRRARHLAHVRLAQLYARMGYPEAAMNQVDVVPTASARMKCRIECYLTLSHQAIDRGALPEGVDYARQIVDRLQKAIQCGAIIDPWNIIGFDGQFSLFPAYENAVHDHRVDELAHEIEQIFRLMSRIMSESAALDNKVAMREIEATFEQFSQWWYQFAAHEVESVDSPNGREAFAAARHVAHALHLWHQGGAAAGDVAFWAPYADMFDSPQAYALVIDALIQREDYVTTMALLVHWLERAEEVGLQQLDASYFAQVNQWMMRLQNSGRKNSEAKAKLWPMMKRFLDFQEANAGSYYEVPGWFSAQPKQGSMDDDLDALFYGDQGDDPTGDDHLFGAAYEDVTFKDSTDDGIEGGVYDPDSGDQSEDLNAESKRINLRLSFLGCLAQSWQMASLGTLGQPRDEEVLHKLATWREQAIHHYRGLLELLVEIHQHPLIDPDGDHQSMVDFDRQRVMKEFLLERTINTTVATASAARIISSVIAANSADESDQLDNLEKEIGAEQSLAVHLVAAIFAKDKEETAERFEAFLEDLKDKPLLYVPIPKRGSPLRIVTARVRQTTIRELLVLLPRVGMYELSRQLLDTARQMENDNPVGPGAITEFDALFETGFRALVDAVVESAQTWAIARKGGEELDNALVECLEQVTQNLLLIWLSHSRTLRLSSVEKFTEAHHWKRLLKFIKLFGHDLFTQYFFNRGNMRGILHTGVLRWISQIEQQTAEEEWPEFVKHLDKDQPRHEAAENITIVLEAVLENYPEYRDYNSTTTQSDRGEYLYMFLDFLRLRSSYDRVAWNLRPIVLAHEVLVRRGYSEAGQLWRHALKQRIGDEAEKYVQRLSKLQQQYAMRMPTVADRIQERFLKPLMVDRVCSLVERAMENVGSPEARWAFDMLNEEAEQLVQQPVGVGLDVPPWLVALEEEVAEIEQRRNHSGDLETWQPDHVIPVEKLSLEEVHGQIDDWAIDFGEDEDGEEET